MDFLSNKSAIILFCAFILALFAVIMYIFWQRFKFIQRKRSLDYEENYDIKTIEKVARQMSMPNSSGANKSDTNSIYPSGSITPPKPARSFSGQLNIKKCSPSIRRLAKINSQIIMFNGQPHIISEQLHRRLSRADIYETKIETKV